MVDSSCTGHVCNSRNYFSGFSPCNGFIHIGSKETISVGGTAIVKLVSNINGNTQIILLKYVLYSQHMIFNSSIVVKKGCMDSVKRLMMNMGIQKMEF